MPRWLPYPTPIIGTLIALGAAIILHYAASLVARLSHGDERDRYRRRKFFSTVIAFAAGIAILILWARTLRQTGTFLGLLGAGVAIALKEPLLSIAGRLAIFAGHMYSAGDRIELQKMSGDVIGIGFFYTRMLEIGAWIGGDQYSGRILLIPNSMIFGTPIMNYTLHLSRIWDEVQLPITYGSDMQAAIKILSEVGGAYTEKFLHDAERDLQQMRHDFLMPELKLEPEVYVKVTSNWLGLTMRYVVDPRQRAGRQQFYLSRGIRSPCKKQEYTNRIGNHGSERTSTTKSGLMARITRWLEPALPRPRLRSQPPPPASAWLPDLAHSADFPPS